MNNNIQKLKHLEPLVVVTGGDGFLARWCIKELLEKGYSVRATLRNLQNATMVRESLIGLCSKASSTSALTFMEADLTSDNYWVEVMQGADLVLHIASPFPSVQPKDENELIVPARDGTMRVLSAALSAGVRKVVMTSSSVTMEYPSEQERPSIITEDMWTSPASQYTNAYVHSKLFAEQAAWRFVRDNASKLSLTTIAPGTMIGPSIGTHLSFSVQAIQKLIDGSAPLIPRLGYGFVDVRDVASLHIAAMMSDRANGERFLAGGHFLWLSDVARILRTKYQNPPYKIPSRMMPDLLVRLMAFFDPSMRSLIKDLGLRHDYSPAKAERILEWNMRPIEETIFDTAQSLIDKKLF